MNPFLFDLKSFFHSQDILVFVSTFLVMYKNDLIIKIVLILECMTSQPGQQTNAIHILPNIARSKGNQAMKFDQLKEYDMRNIFAEKSYSKYAGEISPRPLSIKPELSISLDRQGKTLSSLFLLYANLRVIEIQ